MEIANATIIANAFDIPFAIAIAIPLAVLIAIYIAIQTAMLIAIPIFKSIIITVAIAIDTQCLFHLPLYVPCHCSSIYLYNRNVDLNIKCRFTAQCWYNYCFTCYLDVQVQSPFDMRFRMRFMSAPLSRCNCNWAGPCNRKLGVT